MAEAAAKPWWQRFLPFGAVAQRPTQELAFPPGFLEALERLRILAVRAAGGGLKDGHRLGAYKGGQLEFHDYRNYVPGDDLRYLDWNLYARLGRPYVKQFAREEAGAIHILLDATPSMALGEPSKWNFARRVAAMFAHIGWSARDRVLVVVYRGAGREVSVFPPPGVRGSTPALLKWLEAQPVAAPAAGDEGADGSATLRPSNAAGALREAVGAFLKRAPARGRTILISDFWQEEAEVSDAVQRLSAAGHDLSALHVLAPEETLAPEGGEWRVIAPEEAGELEISATPAAGELYRVELDAHRAAIAGILRRRGGQYLFERPDTALERVLLQTLRRQRWVV